MDSGPLKDRGVPIIQGCENATGELETASGSIGSSARSARVSEDVHKAAPSQFLPEPPPTILKQNYEADLEEAYILSAFRRKDENDMADGWKGVFLDLSHNGHNGHNGEAKEAPEAADTAGTGLPSVESLRATLQALRVQDRLRMEAPLVPTVPTVPMAAMAAAGCQLEPDEQSSDVGRAIGGAELAVTNAQFNAEAQLLA